MKYLLIILPFLTFGQNLTIGKPKIKKGLHLKCDAAILQADKYDLDFIKANNTIIYLEPNVKLAIKDNVYGVQVICNKENDSINKPQIYMKKCERINTKVCINVKVVYPEGCELSQ